MADNSILPKAQSQLVDQAGRPTRAFYDFFRALVNGFQGQIDKISALLSTLGKVTTSLGGDANGDGIVDVSAAIESKADKATQVIGAQSIAGGGRLEGDIYLRLANDVDVPSPLTFYGSLAADDAGWHGFSPDAFAVGDDGTLDLASLTATALTDLTYPRVVALDGAGNAYYPDLTVPTDVARIVGVTLHAATAGTPVGIVTSRDFTESAWNWSPGRIYCALSGGGLTQTAPTTGAIVEVARVVTPTTIRVGIQPGILR